jgi:hypothetical protein
VYLFAPATSWIACARSDYSLHAHSHTLLELGQVYNQLSAPFGQLAASALTVSTYALESDSAGDVTDANLESRIALWTAERDSVTAQIQSMLEGAEFSGQALNEQEAKQLIDQGRTEKGRRCPGRPRWHEPGPSEHPHPLKLPDNPLWVVLDYRWYSINVE